MPSSWRRRPVPRAVLVARARARAFGAVEDVLEDLQLQGLARRAPLALGSAAASAEALERGAAERALGGVCSSVSGSAFLLSPSPCPPGTVPHSHLGCYFPGHPPFLSPPVNLPKTERLGQHSWVVPGFPKVVITPQKDFCLVIFQKSPGRQRLEH